MADLIKRGGRQHAIRVRRDDPATIEAAWHQEMLRTAALRAALPARLKLLEALEGVEPDLASRIYARACYFMGTAMDGAVAVAGAARTCDATPDTETDAAFEARLKELAERADPVGIRGNPLACIIDGKTRGWYHRKCDVIDRAIEGVPPPIRAIGPKPPSPLRPGHLFAAEELQRLRFQRRMRDHGRST